MIVSDSGLDIMTLGTGARNVLVMTACWAGRRVIYPARGGMIFMPAEYPLGRDGKVSCLCGPIAVEGRSRTCFRMAEMSGRSTSLNF